MLARWSRVKHNARKEAQIAAAQPAAAKATPAPAESEPPLTDADMPPLETLTSDSELAPFLSRGVSDSLKRKAFRKIFLGGQFNIRDGLDDYDEDFTHFTALGDVVTTEYRRWRERYDKIEEKQQAEAAAAETKSEAATSDTRRDDAAPNAAANTETADTPAADTPRPPTDDGGK